MSQATKIKAELKSQQKTVWKLTENCMETAISKRIAKIAIFKLS